MKNAIPPLHLLCFNYSIQIEKGNNRDVTKKRKNIVQRNVKYINARAAIWYTLDSALVSLRANIVRTYMPSIRVCIVYVCTLSYMVYVYGIAAVNSIFACTAFERAPM